MSEATIHIMQEPKVTLGAEVRIYRERAGMSQERLAESLGVSRETVSKIERGDTKRPSNKILQDLENVLGFSRIRAYQLIGELNLEGETDPAVLLQQIAALPTQEERLTAWHQLPVGLRQAITTLMQDVLTEAMQQVQAASPSILSQTDHPTDK